MAKTLRKYWVTVLAGFLMLLIAGEQVSNNPVTSNAGEEVSQQADTEGKEKQEQNSGFVFSTVKTIVPIFHPDITTGLYVVHELRLLCEFSFKIIVEKPLYTSSYFFRLFRLIIAPNAP